MVGVRIVRVFNRYTLAVLFVVMTGFIWLRGQTGSLSYYQKQADDFMAANSMEYIEVLVNPDWSGRAIGSSGLDAAAQYIAEQFKALEIQPAGDNMTYFQPRTRAVANLDAIPRLQIADGGSDPIYHQDYVEQPLLPERRVSQGPIRFLAWRTAGNWRLESRVYGTAKPGLLWEILMLLSVAKQPTSIRAPCRLLVVTDDPIALERRSQCRPLICSHSLAAGMRCTSPRCISVQR
jgi:hypothetical protein